MTDIDNVENDDDGSDEYAFDPTTATDAGLGEELSTGIIETQKVVLREATQQLLIDDYLEDARREPNIRLRAKKLQKNNLINFPDTKKTAEGCIAMNSDKNRIAAFECLFGNGDSRPHIDTFCGRLVDWEGRIVDDRYSMVEMLDALHVMGLRLQAMETIRKSFREWGLQVQRNDLIKKFNEALPIWDGTPRLEDKLISLFQCFDTPLNRNFGKYFWLSLYCRIKEPGCMAPMVLSLFGGQDAGKSYFSVLICRILIGDPYAYPVQLDMGANKIDFLRAITGHAIVANIGEMTGFSRTDLNDIKQFTSATSDDMHQKFEGHFQQRRQWIAIMDGNKYEGLQRDDTGNRRFYPMFVGQVPDLHGHPNWDINFKSDFTGFDTELWQIMAECRVWLEGNGGMDGYNSYVEQVSSEVKAFSQDEMSKGRGAVVDYALDTYLVPVLSELRKLDAEILDGRKNRGLWMTTAAIKARIKMMSKGGDVKENHLKVRMVSLGATAELCRNVRGYLFRDIMDEDSFLRKIGVLNDEEELKVVEKFKEDADGF